MRRFHVNARDCDPGALEPRRSSSWAWWSPWRGRSTPPGPARGKQYDRMADMDDQAKWWMVELGAMRCLAMMV